MNKRAGKLGATKPSREEVAQFDLLSIHELQRFLAAGRVAIKRKLKHVRSKPKSA